MSVLTKRKSLIFFRIYLHFIDRKQIDNALLSSSKKAITFSKDLSVVLKHHPPDLANLLFIIHLLCQILVTVRLFGTSVLNKPHHERDSNSEH
jgi:hypothetical protein